MALQTWSPELRLTENIPQTVSVSTGPSLELCTFPSTLGSSVATAALEQLFAVEKSLESDYFKCNEEAKTFLKNTAIAVKKLEEMRKQAIDLLEIESMELSRLYFLLETIPYNISKELEECVRDARRVNLFEISQLHMKVTRQTNEIQMLKKKASDLSEANENLGEKQEELVRQHEKFVIAFNQIMRQKAEIIVCINETYTNINVEEAEIELQKKCISSIEEELETQKAEYYKRKKELTEQLDEYIKQHDQKRTETYKMKKKLDNLMLKMSKIKETVASRNVVLSDHNLEIARLHESLNYWKKHVENMNKFCNALEEKTNFIVTTKEEFVDSATDEKKELLNQIKQMAEKLQQSKLRNKELQKKLKHVTRQYRLVLKEEDRYYEQKQKAYEENNKNLTFISEKENFLLKRKIDIKNMEEGLVTLTDLLRATKEVFRKQVKILSDNLQRENQRCALTQWKVNYLQRKFSRWIMNENSSLNDLSEKIQTAEQRRLLLLHEVRYAKETQTTKEKEEELVQCLPHLQEAEEEFTDKNQRFIELSDTISALKQERKLLSDSTTQCSRDFSRYYNNVGKLKQDLKSLREQESQKLKDHFEILKNLENEVYTNDLGTDALFLDNERLKKYIAYMKRSIEQYRKRQEDFPDISKDKSSQLINEQTQYLSLWNEYRITVNELVSSGDETLQEIKNLIEKLHIRDKKIEQIRVSLQENLDQLYFLMNQEPQKIPRRKKKKKSLKNVPFVVAQCKAVGNLTNKQHQTK
ncbi:coiled-coil domain-containing protein 175 isoform X2 [Erinaceus europaeus]|uniref:Coiled-coil domain-containing protein 175 isoform X2 n=1 Tax=Erinaceus europaeus TaxID=9365 RepID=A0ABM3W2S6_ERIEU|nr:coiled-coil domain-containing protein 175 isoform X2 [Erinaceus europaeus]